jgi:GTP pyrophosphokinase
MYRHQEMCRIILIDYGFIDGLLHKAAVTHDLIEDIKDFDTQLILNCDKDGPEVLKLILEVSRRPGESKKDFLSRIYNEGSDNACLIKAADRIHNLSDCQFLMDKNFISNLCDESEQYVIPIAKRVCNDMVTEMTDLIKQARKLLTYLTKDEQ